MTQGCGYVCPVCEGRQIAENGETCTWCSPSSSKKKESSEKTKEVSQQEWLDQTHNRCCGDL